MKRFSMVFFTIFVMMACVLFQESIRVKAVSVGDRLYSPEEGWTRYDDTDSRIVYDGNSTLLNRSNGNVYKNTYHYTNPNMSGVKIKFQFYGTKLRIITWKCFDNSGANVKIDGIDYGNYSNYISDSGGSYLFFERSNLEKCEHRVEITSLDKSMISPSGSQNYFTLDAIDIDSDGDLMTYNTIAAKSLTIDKSKEILNMGESITIKSEVLPANAANREVVWSSSNTSVASVDNNGNIKAVGVGSAVISAQVKGTSLKKICNVVVKPNLPKIIKVKNIDAGVKINDISEIDLSIDNIDNVVSVDTFIDYDKDKLEFIKAEANSGVRMIKVVNESGKVRVVFKKSNTENNFLAVQTPLVKLFFKGKETGEAIIMPTSGNISDGMRSIRTLEDGEFGWSKLTVFN